MSKSTNTQIPIEKTTLQITNVPKRIDLVSQKSSAGSCEFAFVSKNADDIGEKTKIASLIKLLDKRYNIEATQLPLYKNDVSQIFIDAGNLKDSSVEEKYQFLFQIFNEIMLNPPTTEEMEDIKKR